ncbi:hypothetical protein KFL_000490310 [Klebsormidium nitens]|uniref:RCC1-like domain-containing protein n=1 Tax=Klebsormidium nitens TaxID=105231 RepID=A0A0U9HI53_KLENI|nr:hypothetical protein KFL_000490310 [Klebsormidium nitens]|eukprot:GAQ80241.1 hypothetical protein KFL_000490310 [Klebsormidium nitens]
MSSSAAAGSSGPKAAEAGELLFAGVTDWTGVGRTEKAKLTPDAKAEKDATYPDLSLPTRLEAVKDIDFKIVASGSASAHAIAIDVDGQLYTWGRNENGQLGHGDLLQRNTPTVVEALKKHKIVKAAAGKQHTVVVTEDGTSFAFGSNKNGQLGTGNLKSEQETSPVKCLVQDATDVACGAEFTVWLTKKGVWSCGLPQYGQLGDGSDHEYNAKASSVQLVYEPQPTPKAIAGLNGKKVVRVACGNNHTVVSDEEGSVYTWGFGAYGRLGHKTPKDEWKPRKVDFFSNRMALPAGSLITAGGAFSGCTAVGGQLYMWGQIKPTGEAWMSPAPVHDLSGWNIRSMDCGSTSKIVSADDSCISFGNATHGELGYGPKGPKSSANAKKIDALNGFHVIKVAAGLAHTLFIVDRTVESEELEKLPVFQPTRDVEEGAAAEEGAKGKRKAPVGKGKAKAEPPAKKGKAAAAPAPAKKGRGKK